MWMGTPSHRRSKAACGLSKPTHRRCRAACGWDKPAHRRSELHVARASPLTAALDLHVVGSRPVTAALSTQGTRHVMQLKCYMQRVSNVVGIGRKGGAKSKQASRAWQRGTRATKDDRSHGQARASSSSRRARRRTEALDVLWPSAGGRAACLPKLAPAAVIRPPAIREKSSEHHAHHAHRSRAYFQLRYRLWIYIAQFLPSELNRNFSHAHVSA